uniref:Uncharacterized protein n=1 Tax=Eutreptiella gymnastica TaxID=73025 RepID=A0A7S4CW80_9EUGL
MVQQLGGTGGVVGRQAWSSWGAAVESNWGAQGWGRDMPIVRSVHFCYQPSMKYCTLLTSSLLTYLILAADPPALQPDCLAPHVGEVNRGTWGGTPSAMPFFFPMFREQEQKYYFTGTKMIPHRRIVRAPRNHQCWTGCSRFATEEVNMLLFKDEWHTWILFSKNGVCWAHL